MNLTNDTEYKEYIYYDEFYKEELIVNDAHSFLRGAFVLLLRGGFILVQLGCIPVENIYIIIMQNIVDITICIVAFGFIGFSLFAGADVGGVIGFDATFTLQFAHKEDFADVAIYGFCVALIGSAIILTCVTGRITCCGHFILTFLYIGVVQPAVMHWVWTSKGIMYKYKVDNFTRVSIKDHGGSYPIHISASIIGLLALLFLGRRIIRLEQLDSCSVASESTSRTFIGYFFIVTGLLALTNPLPAMVWEDITGGVMVNNLMSIGGGLTVVILFNKVSYGKKIYRYWVPISCMQGSIAGLVTTAPAVDLYGPWIAFFIASVGTVFYFLIADRIRNTYLEDDCNIVAIHLTCGLIGIVAPPLLASDEYIGPASDILIQLYHVLWQIVCAIGVVITHVIFFSIVLFGLSMMGCLRNTYEKKNNERGSKLQKTVKKKSFCCGRVYPYNKFKSLHIAPGFNNDKVDNFSTDEESKFLLS